MSNIAKYLKKSKKDVKQLYKKCLILGLEPRREPSSLSYKKMFSGLPLSEVESLKLDLYEAARSVSHCIEAMKKEVS